jgi:phosphoglycolate phosphatase
MNQTRNTTLPYPDAVIFDWDSTLVNNWGAIHSSLNATLIEMGQTPWTEEETRNRANASARDSFQKLFGEDYERALNFFYSSFERFHLDEIVILEGAKNILESLTEYNIFIAIVSNKNGSHLRKEVSKLGWSNYFKNIVGATDASRDKPSVEPVKMALKGAGITDTSKIWFVGDTALDMECAISSDCIPILIGGELVAKMELEEWPPYKIFSSCEKLNEAFINIV